MINHLYYKQGLITGGLFSCTVTIILTNMYIDNYYILIPKKMSAFLETYKKMTMEGRVN